MDFTSLTGTKKTVGSIRQWVNSDAVPAEEVLADAENWLAQMLRVRTMQKRVVIALAKGASQLDLATINATDYLDPVILWLNGDNMEVDLVPEFEIDRIRGADYDGSVTTKSAPEYYSPAGESLLLFDAQADRDYTLAFTYYGRPESLSPTNLTNLYTRKYQTLLRHLCLANAYIFLKDESRADALLALASSEVKQIAEMDDMGQRGMNYDTRER